MLVLGYDPMKEKCEVVGIAVENVEMGSVVGR
jgi:hypothetical protein